MDPARHARTALLEEIGWSGQQRLAAATVVVVGAGGLGAPVLSYLAAAGVGRLEIIDDDVIEVSNLQRQVLFRTADVGSGKAVTAAAVLRQLNPDIEVAAHPVRLSEANAAALIAAADVVVDGTDNFEARHTVNTACAQAGIPLVWASILRFDAQVSVWWAGHGPCYRCVFPHPPGAGAVPSCAEAGVLGPMVGAIGSVQAVEAVKLLLGIGQPLIGRMLVHDALRQSWEEIPVRADPACPVCGTPAAFSGAASAPGQPGSVLPALEVPEVQPAQLREWMAADDALTLIDVRTEAERAGGTIPGSRPIAMARFRDGSALPPLQTFADGAPGAQAHKLVLVCASGVRSREAASIARAAGLPAYSLHGGYTAWNARGGVSPL